MLWKSENETPNLKLFCVLTVSFFSDSRFSPWGWPQIWACTHIIPHIYRFGCSNSGWLFVCWRCDAVLCYCVLPQKDFADRSGVAASRLRWWFGSRLFSILALVVFLVKFILKSAPKSSFSLWRRDPVLELQFLLPLCTLKLLCVKASLCRKIRV